MDSDNIRIQTASAVQVICWISSALVPILSPLQPGSPPDPPPLELYHSLVTDYCSLQYTYFWVSAWGWFLPHPISAWWQFIASSSWWILPHFRYMQIPLLLTSCFFFSHQKPSTHPAIFSSPSRNEEGVKNGTGGVCYSTIILFPSFPGKWRASRVGAAATVAEGRERESQLPTQMLQWYQEVLW